jgi:hypothetical protein
VEAHIVDAHAAVREDVAGAVHVDNIIGPLYGAGAVAAIPVMFLHFFFLTIVPLSARAEKGFPAFLRAFFGLFIGRLKMFIASQHIFEKTWR